MNRYNDNDSITFTGADCNTLHDILNLRAKRIEDQDILIARLKEQLKVSRAHEATDSQLELQRQNERYKFNARKAKLAEVTMVQAYLIEREAREFFELKSKVFSSMAGVKHIKFTSTKKISNPSPNNINAIVNENITFETYA